MLQTAFAMLWSAQGLGCSGCLSHGRMLSRKRKAEELEEARKKEEQLMGKNQMRSLPREAFFLNQLFRTRVHVLRAPDPSLRVRYRRVDCLSTWPQEVNLYNL